MPGNLAYKTYQLIWEALDWLYPPVCGGCGKDGYHWCYECQANCLIIRDQGCNICGDLDVQGKICNGCEKQRPLYKQLRSWGVFKGPLRNALHSLKYKGDIGLGSKLAGPMLHDLSQLNWQVEMVVPVPLSLARFQERGYNQAALLARPIAIGLRLPYRTACLRKIRETQTQVGLRAEERRINVLGAYEAAKEAVAGKKILLIDDVATSGSTLNECAAALLRAGATEVYGYTLARAGYHTHTSEKPEDSITI
jgi:ComF family protein